MPRTRGQAEVPTRATKVTQSIFLSEDEFRLMDPTSFIKGPRVADHEIAKRLHSQPPTGPIMHESFTDPYFGVRALLFLSELSGWMHCFDGTFSDYVTLLTQDQLQRIAVMLLKSERKPDGHQGYFMHGLLAATAVTAAFAPKNEGEPPQGDWETFYKGVCDNGHAHPAYCHLHEGTFSVLSNGPLSVDLLDHVTTPERGASDLARFWVDHIYHHMGANEDTMAALLSTEDPLVLDMIVKHRTFLSTVVHNDRLFAPLLCVIFKHDNRQELQILLRTCRSDPSVLAQMSTINTFIVNEFKRYVGASSKHAFPEECAPVIHAICGQHEPEALLDFQELSCEEARVAILSLV